MSFPLLFAALILAGCGGDDTADTGVDSQTDTATVTDTVDTTDTTDTHETGTEPADVDGDGYGDDIDCDDADPDVYPGAPEVCDEDDNDCDGEVDEDVQVEIFPDEDGDGYGETLLAFEGCAAKAGESLVGGDCDDDDPETYPDAPEQCDEVDNDCDDEVDEDLTEQWWADSDGDGYGNPEFSIIACDVDASWVANGDDCDDTSGAASPAGTEVCDDLDNDCDGLFDDDDPDVLDPSTWYADADSDGYGADTYTLEACVAPSGYVDRGGDCDDSDAAFHPDATEEDCTDPADYNCDGSVGYADADGDGYAACEDCDDADATVSPNATEICDGADNDCDGDTDEDDAWDATTWFEDTDGDGYGVADSTHDACEAPSGFVDNDEDCDDDDSSIHPEAAETCDGVDEDCDGDTDEDASDADTFYVDTDGDGFGSSAFSLDACDTPSGFVDNTEDCNDGDPSVNPDAAETCDGVDEDCDGTTDEDPTDPDTFYVDSDSDGYGDPDNTAEGCEAPSGTVDNSEDCDDADGSIHPGAGETCDAGDEDCDGLEGEDDPDLSGSVPTWYIDHDGDGHGSADYTVEACDQPSGYVATGEDCDDLDASASPSEAEVCDGVDNDCNGTTDDDDPGLDATSASTWYADDDGDGYGDPSGSTTIACDAPSGTADNADDCDDTSAAVHPAATEVCNGGTDDDCSGDADDDDSGLDTSTADTWYTDDDGDGYGDPAGATTLACEQPSGFADNADDCDDGNAGAGATCADGSSQALAGTTCATLLADDPSAVDGTYWIDPDADGDTSDAFQVHCDMANGGWAYASSGVPFTLGYTGGTQTLESVGVEATYLFTAYGAAAGQGHNAAGNSCGSGSLTGGHGGSATGSITLAASTTLYVEVGGQGDDGTCADQGTANLNVGGYNGGGRGSRGGSAGGGGTDLRTTDGDLSSRILVGGGGGGCGYESCIYGGGHGGGETGGTSDTGATGGTQTAGGTNGYGSGDGSFGVGGDNVQDNDEAGGGGGWYGGAAGGTANTAGSGGSSYTGGMDGDQATSTGVNSGDGYLEYVFR